MKYSSEFACFDEAVAKAQQMTFNRKNLNCLTEGRNGKLQQYNPLTDACSVEFYTKTVTEAAPAVEEASAVAEIAEIEQAMADYRDGKLVQTRAAMSGH